MYTINTKHNATQVLLTSLGNLLGHPKVCQGRTELKHNTGLSLLSSELISNVAIQLCVKPYNERDVRVAGFLVTFLGQSCTLNENGEGTLGTRNYSAAKAAHDRAHAALGLSDKPIGSELSAQDLSQILLLATEAAKPDQHSVDLLSHGAAMLPTWGHTLRPVADCIEQLRKDIPVPAPAEPKSYVVEIKVGDGWRQVILAYHTEPGSDAKDRIWKLYQEKIKVHPNNEYRFTALYS